MKFSVGLSTKLTVHKLSCIIVLQGNTIHSMIRGKAEQFHGTTTTQRGVKWLIAENR